MIASKEAVRSAYVLRGGDDEDGWSWLEAKRGEADCGITTEGQEARQERWINLGEGDDVTASKFLCGGQGGGSLTTKEGDGLAWWQGRGTWVHLYHATTETGSYLVDMAPRYLGTFIN